MIASVIAGLLLLVGVFFLAVAAIGFVRLPDVFCRLHITGVIDTMGSPLVLLGAAVYLGFTLEAGKLLLAIVFLYVTAPLVGHLLAQAALEAGYRPVLDQADSTRPASVDPKLADEDDGRLQTSAAATGSGSRPGGEA